MGGFGIISLRRREVVGNGFESDMESLGQEEDELNTVMDMDGRS